MDENNLSFEPMDIDLSLSAHSIDNMDISFNDANNGIDTFLGKLNSSIKSTPTGARDEVTETVQSTTSDQSTPLYTTVKKFHITMPKDASSTHNAVKVRVVFAALVLLLSAITYQIVNIRCSDGINPDILRKSLSNKLYGQSKAVDALVEVLTVNDESKVLILYGSTGVGKTFAASILLKHVGSHSNVYHYTMPSFMETFTTDFMVGLTLCKDSIIIVDDLSPKDLDIKEHITNILTKSDSLEKVVTIILIYNNCITVNDFKKQCDESFPAEITDHFKEINANKQIIRFESLTQEHLRKCIETELGPKKLTDHQLAKVLKSFDVSVDGCKGVHMKMKLMDIS